MRLSMSLARTSVNITESQVREGVIEALVTKYDPFTIFKI